MSALKVGMLETEPNALQFYSETLAVLNKSQIPYLVGGAYALAKFTEVERHTKDFDIFTRKEDCHRILNLLAEQGYKTELTFPHWLGKAFSGGAFIDVIFSSGNGIVEVDDEWFEHAIESEVLGVRVKICPPEEILWSKAFIMERERYDGADVAHLIHAYSHRLDWERLLQRFGSNWLVLFNHLIMFRFIYPAERDYIPRWVMEECLKRMRQELNEPAPKERLCQGTLVSREQYLSDVDRLGYEDARLMPWGKMTEADIAHWTAGINHK